MSLFKHVFYLGFLAAVLGPSAALADALYTDGHADIAIGAEGDLLEFEIGWHTEDNAIVDGEIREEEFEPGGLKAVISDLSRKPASADVAALLGVSEGTDIWSFGQFAEPGVPFLGFGADELSPDDWESPVSFALEDFSGPGDFALYQPGPEPFMQTIDGVNAEEDFFVIDEGPGGHDHAELAFSAPGEYTLTLTGSAVRSDTGEVVSATGDFVFLVSVSDPGEPGGVIPEPSSITGLLGLLMITGWKRRTRRANG